MRILVVCSACIFLTAAEAQLMLVDGSDIVMTGSVGSQIVFPDGTVQSTAAGSDPVPGHGGLDNTVSGNYAFVGGGRSNTASGNFSAISGGRNNQAAASFATIAGGGYTTVDLANRVTDRWGTVGGGRNNQAGDNAGTTDDSEFATVSGGANNTAGSPYATAGGGQFNEASGNYATVNGGQYNFTEAQYATIGGGGPTEPLEPTGTRNIVYDNFGTIAGGGGNQAGGDDADSTLQPYATVSGGRDNNATGGSATVGGGGANTASGYGATVGGGNANAASGGDAAIGGGGINLASGLRSTVAGGGQNDATGTYSSVGGGQANTASGTRATVGGGQGNTATGSHATVAGGNFNAAAGDYTFAAGRQAKIAAAHDGSFVFADAIGLYGADFNSAAANEFAARATGGVRFITNSGLTSGAVLTAGDSTWGAPSSKALKENKRQVDSVAILEKLASIPVEEWNYIHQDKSIRHIGPYAEDFHAAFGLSGEFDGRITTQDFDGVELAAIQGLNTKLQRDLAQLRTEKDSQIAALTWRLTELEARLSE